MTGEQKLRTLLLKGKLFKREREREKQDDIFDASNQNAQLYSQNRTKAVDILIRELNGSNEII